MNTLAMQVQRMVVTCPVATLDENTGSRYVPPGTEATMVPCFRPFIDALHKLTSAKLVTAMRDEHVLEVCPLQHMRGRTFENTWIIADDMQDSTPAQMRMLLTRLGHGSKLVRMLLTIPEDR